MKSHAALVIGAAIGTAAMLAHLRSANAGCSAYQCGGNSPIITGQPITNIDLTGAEHAGVQLTTTLLSAPRCQTDNGRVRTLTLGIDHGELTATEGSYVCRGADLIDAQLRLTVTPEKTAVPVTLVITSAQQLPTWERTKNKPNVLWAYRFAVEESLSTVEYVPVPGGKRIRKVVVPMRRRAPLCENRLTYEAWQDFQDLDGTAWKLTGVTMMSMESPTESALIVQGAAFDDTGSVIKENATILADARWFNIACVGTSVAKMRLLGVDPMNELPAAKYPSPPGASSATLKMLGARYDGKKAETKPGTPLMWARAWRPPVPLSSGSPIDDGFFGHPVRVDGDDMERGPIEAGWGPFGATCLSHFRPPLSIGEYRLRGSATRFAGAREAREVAKRREQLHLPECDPDHMPIGTLWVTTTVDHMWHVAGSDLPEFWTVNGVQFDARTAGSAAPVFRRPIPPVPPAALVQPVPTAHPVNPAVVKPPTATIPKASVPTPVKP